MSQLEFHNGIEEDEKVRFADVVLPIPIPQLYTYRIPKEFKIIAKTKTFKPRHEKIMTSIIKDNHIYDLSNHL